MNPVPVPLLEVHLLDWREADGGSRGGSLYGEHLRVRFLKKLRDEEKFDGLEALRDAIARDVQHAREFFERHG